MMNMLTTQTAIGNIPRVNVLGVGISALNLPLAVSTIAGAIERRQRGYVCVTGVHGVMEAQSDPELRGILNRAFLNTPDGMPMVWLGRLDGHRHMSRVYGPDLMIELCQFPGCRHFFYGGSNGTALALKERMEVRIPGIQIVGTYEPPWRPLTDEENTALSSEVERARPDILWVGLSTPKQERFMAQYLPRLRVPLMIGVGAAFDMHAGRLKQAPRWMQRSGLEWVYRLTREPRRLWRRYLRNNPRFLWAVTLQLTGVKEYSLP
jgi:N-acetylglucosaminyldiphosphoundecaprenol N-acetyl-beta-D-mannosaminyltransferase